MDPILPFNTTKCWKYDGHVQGKYRGHAWANRVSELLRQAAPTAWRVKFNGRSFCHALAASLRRLVVRRALSHVCWPVWPSFSLTVAALNDLFSDLKKSFSYLKNHPALGTSSSPPPPTTHGNPSTDILSRIPHIAHYGDITDIINFFVNHRFNDPAYLSVSIILVTVFLTMSWFSRGTGGTGWGGRFSPFGRPGNSPNSGEVSDSDFSYITSEDLKKANSARPEIVDWDDKNPDRDTDVLIFKNGRTQYQTHFPAQSIRDGDLRISTIRQAAAKKIGVDDPRRIRMFFKGKNLKYDERTAREEGLRGDGSGSEILCVVGEAAAGTMAPGAEEPDTRVWSDGEDEGEDTESGVDSGANAPKKKSRKRGGKKSKKKNTSANASGSNTPGYVNAAPTGAEYLPIPSNIPGPRPTSTTPSNTSRAATPMTALGKLDAIASKFHTELVPLCVKFMQSPPGEKAKKDFEYKKLSETILTQVLMKLDSVETEGDQDARARRKELVKEVQGMLNKLDEVGK